MRTFKKIFLVLSGTERSVALFALASAALSGLLLAATAFEKATISTPAKGGEYTEGVVGQPAYVNPVLASNEVDKALVRLAFETLGNLSLKLEPDKDNRLWHVRLKENLRWSDGEKLTSDDVVFTIQKIQDPDAQSPIASNWQGIAVSRESELELKFALAAPYAFFKDTLDNLVVIPKHIFKELPVANWRLSDYNLSPVGSGPYQASSFEKRSDGFIVAFHLEENPFYSGTAPFIEKVSLRFFESSEGAIAAFNGGRIDGFLSLQPDDMQSVKRPFRSVSFRLPSYYAVFLNQNRNLALKNASVRKALSVAIDKTAIINDVFGGRGVPVEGPIPPGGAYFSEPGAPSSSPESAAEILDSAGWKLDSDGIRKETVKNSTATLEFSLTVPDVQFLVKTARSIATSWKNLGVSVDVAVLPPEEIVGGAIKNRDYEALLFGNVLGQNSDLFSFWHSSERFSPGLNLALYNNKKADQLIETIRGDTDEASRAEEFSELERLIADDYPVVFLYSSEYTYITNKSVRGVGSGVIADAADRFKSIPSWYLKTALVLK